MALEPVPPLLPLTSLESVPPRDRLATRPSGSGRCPSVRWRRLCPRKILVAWNVAIASSVSLNSPCPSSHTR